MIDTPPRAGAVWLRRLRCGAILGAPASDPNWLTRSLRQDAYGLGAQGPPEARFDQDCPISQGAGMRRALGADLTDKIVFKKKETTKQRIHF